MISSYGLAVWTLAVRELVRFVRQRTRVIGAFGQPVLFWVLFGAGLRGSFQAPDWAPAGTTYQEYFLPGVAVLILLFTAIFSTISIIEDRKEGFLQGVLVAPIPRSALVLGKLCGGTVLAVGQAVLFLILGVALSRLGVGSTMHWSPGWGAAIRIVAFLTLVGFTLTALGYVIAWPLDSTQGFHAIMSVFLMPMWLLSGAFFPGGSSGWLSWIIRLNPLTYGVAGLRRLMYADRPLAVTTTLPSMTVCVAVSAAFCAICFVAACVSTSRRSVRNVR